MEHLIQAESKEKFIPAKLTFERLGDRLILKFFGVEEKQSLAYTRAIEKCLEEKHEWVEKKEGFEDTAPGWHAYELIGKLSDKEIPEVIEEIHKLAKSEVLEPDDQFLV